MLAQEGVASLATKKIGTMLHIHTDDLQLGQWYPLISMQPSFFSGNVPRVNAYNRDTNR